MTSSLVGQKVTISGYIYDNETQEQLIGANIFDELSQKGSISNNYGYYSMSLDAQSVQLNYSYIGYTDQQLSILLTKDTIVDIYLEPQVQLEVVEIIE